MVSLAARVMPLPTVTSRSWLLVERNLLVYRRLWLLIVSGFFEPLFYLLAVGVGIGKLVGTVEVAGHAVGYTTFVAPGLLAASAMNGAIYESTMNIFFKLKYAKLYDAVLSTPVGPGDVAVGEITFAQLRGVAYSVAFLVVMAGMGLVHSWWALLALPATILLGSAFGAAGMATTTFMRSWQDFEFVQLAILPMFLFATTFYPLSTYPRGLQIVVELTPLYHGVQLLRALTTGVGAGPGLLVHVAYLLVMALLGVAVTARRLDSLLLR